MKARLDGIFAEAQAFGRLGGAHSLDIPEHDDRPVVAGRDSIADSSRLRSSACEACGSGFNSSDSSLLIGASSSPASFIGGLASRRRALRRTRASAS
jgi:hypothetical protein